MTMARNLNQLYLLLWKNYRLQRRRKLFCVLEMGLPALLVTILLVLRQMATPEHIDHPTHWEAFSVEELPAELVPRSANHSPEVNWRLCYSPDLPITQRLLSRVAKKLNITVEGLAFPTEQNLLSFLAIENASNADILGAVTFASHFPEEGSTVPAAVSYTIRLKAEHYFGRGDRVRNKRASDWWTGYVFQPDASIAPRELNETEGGTPGYYREGFLAIQRAMDISILLEHDPAIPWDDVTLQLKRHPFPAYTDDPFVTVIQQQLPLAVLLSFLLMASSICKEVVFEKECNLKEFMQTMGLRNWQHWLAWSVKYVIFGLITVLIMTLLLFLDLGKGGIFNHSDPSFILVFLFLYCLATTLFCFLISTAFSKASTGAAAGAVIFLATYLPYVFLANRYAGFTLRTKALSCLLHNVAMAFGCYLIGIHEGRGAGLRWQNLHQPVSVTDDFTMHHVMLMLLLDCVVYGLAAWYVDAIRPGSHGKLQPCYFPFKRSYWCGPEAYESSLLLVENEERGPTYQHPEFFEASPGLRAGIAIRNLKKVFKSGGQKKVAVDDLLLDMYEGQITALLGHNGAGKTTTMLMLTGFLASTGGTAYVNGYDIRHHLDIIRNSLGLCPQHDILFDNMTVEEHLYFFGKLKGVREHNIREEVQHITEVLGLESKSRTVVQKLSGGLRRKVSVGIALIGDSKVVLLDEPSSGMDPQSRRQLWKILQGQKHGRTMILCTHAMDEAEFLGDRIAIMAKGKAKCCGSPLFLKKKYGVGYRMALVKEPHCSVSNVTHLVQSHVPLAQMNSSAAELSYTLPKESSSHFEALFTDLEASKRQLGVVSFGASVTTMEEVFLKVGRAEEEPPIHGKQTSMVDGAANSRGNSLSRNSTQDGGSACRTVCIEKNSGWHHLVQQYRALIFKHLIHSWRSRLFTAMQLIVPLWFVLVACLIVNSYPGPGDPPAIDLSLGQYREPVVPYTVDTVPGARRSMARNLSSAFDSLMPGLTSDVSSFLSYASTPNLEHYLLLTAATNFTHYVNDYIVAAAFSQKSQDSSAGVVGFFNNEALHSPAVALNYIDNALLQYYLGDDVSVHVTNHPLPRQATTRSEEEAATSAQWAMILGYQISFAVCFLTGSFAVHVIAERSTKAKHIQYVSGTHAATYWASTFAWNWLTILVLSACIVTMFGFFDIQAFSEGQQGQYLFVSLMLYGCAVLPYVYLMSYFFELPASGYVWITVLNIFLATVPMLAVELLRSPVLGAQKIATWLRWVVMLLVPNYTLQVATQGLYRSYESLRVCRNLASHIPHASLEDFCAYMASMNQTSVCCKDNCTPGCTDDTENYLAWSPPGIGRALCCMALQFTVYFLLLVFTDSGLYKSWRQGSRPPSLELASSVPSEEDNTQVGAAKDRIRATSGVFQPTQSNALVVSGVQKYYGEFLAVDKITVRVPRGECFGLLGVNGAGKTTVFKMLTGEEMLSAGDAWLQGWSVKSNIKKAQQSMGYCPQSDALIKQMTVKETLTMYGRLRGVREELLAEVVENLINNLALEPYIEKQAGHLSGGNRRKLSTGIALIGDPPIVFLDEPTTGMDPTSRRRLWDTLARARATGQTIVLTSHSMEECEVLCTRLAIMVNGKFECLGSPQELKSKFGEGYTLMAKVAPTHDQKSLELHIMQLQAFIKHEFQNSQLKDSEHGCLYYHIASGQKSWANIFGTMERARAQFHVEDYFVNQTTLEDVFLSFARGQRTHELKKVSGTQRCKDCWSRALCCSHRKRVPRAPRDTDIKMV